jgi:hypothetical protein
MGKSSFHKQVFSLVLMTGIFSNIQAQTPQSGFEHLTMEQGHNVFDIEDLYDDEGNASGTKVILRIRYKEMTEDNR